MMAIDDPVEADELEPRIMRSKGVADARYRILGRWRAMRLMAPVSLGCAIGTPNRPEMRSKDCVRTCPMSGASDTMTDCSSREMQMDDRRAGDRHGSQLPACQPDCLLLRWLTHGRRPIKFFRALRRVPLQCNLRC